MYLVAPYQQCAETRLGIKKVKPKALHLHLVLCLLNLSEYNQILASIFDDQFLLNMMNFYQPDFCQTSII